MLQTESLLLDSRKRPYTEVAEIAIPYQLPRKRLKSKANSKPLSALLRNSPGPKNFPVHSAPPEIQEPVPITQKQTHTRKTDGFRVPLVPNVSKLWLTRRALKEFDRRNQENRCSPRAIPSTWTDNLYATAKNPSNQLKRFARHGGPDLRDLRAVS
jgi:hypothetical protein